MNTDFLTGRHPISRAIGADDGENVTTGCLGRRQAKVNTAILSHREGILQELDREPALIAWFILDHGQWLGADRQFQLRSPHRLPTGISQLDLTGDRLAGLEFFLIEADRQFVMWLDVFSDPKRCGVGCTLITELQSIAAGGGRFRQGKTGVAASIRGNAEIAGCYRRPIWVQHCQSHSARCQLGRMPGILKHPPN